MLPNNAPGQTSDPASLPPVQGAALPPQPQPAAAPASIAAPTVVAQAKQLVEQYQGNPYQLSGALQQLKSRYLAEQFHINPKSGQQ